MTSDLDQGALRAQLDAGLAALSLAVEPRQREALVIYVELLAKWNRAYNLSGISDPRTMVSHHLLDSLSVTPFIDGKSCIDVGTGAGVPGLVLAIARPDQYWILIDSNQKKARFLTQAVIELGLENVEVVGQRAETYHPRQTPSTIITRATGTLYSIIENVHHLCTCPVRFLAMKGKYPEDELKDIRRQYPDYETHRLIVPQIDAERHLVVVRLGTFSANQSTVQ